jgi:2-polyprenyl-3-methyl-5-hydroxy-6-metoxy-1,4-benzoquinol methylase
MGDLKHWQEVYSTRSTDQVGWYTPHLSTSISLINQIGLLPEDPIIDVGGGASTLVDDLLDTGYKEICVLDLSEQAMLVAKERLGSSGSLVSWLQGDITKVDLPANHFKLWHDRAVFHFLLESAQQQAYRDKLGLTLRTGGHVVIGTFDLDGPAHCSGLPVQRYNEITLSTFFGPGFRLVRHHHEVHTTPSDVKQRYLYCHFEKG